MTNETDFFDDAAGGSGAPTGLLKTPGDYIHGEVLEFFKRPYIPFGKKDPEKNDDGTDKQQLVIIVQTQFRNWQGVNKIPKVDPSDENSAEKAPSEDDGRRAIYVPEKKNIQFAIGRAVSEAGQRLAVGGVLGVKVIELKPTDKGNPLKVHEAMYQPPSAADGFFGGQQAPAQSAPPAQAQPPAQAAPPAQQAPAQQAPPAQQDPWASQPAQAPQQAAPAQQDPWASPAPAAGNQPPF